MPYLGILKKSEKYEVDVKVYGPEDDFADTTNQRLQDTVTGLIAVDNLRASGTTATKIATSIAGLVKDDPNVVWVECTIREGNGIYFGGTSEIA